VDENGGPAACTIDMILEDGNSLYFLAAKGKAFYGRLKAHRAVPITGLQGWEIPCRPAP